MAVPRESLASSPFHPDRGANGDAASSSDEESILTLPQAARVLGVSVTTLKRWSAQGRMPHARTAGGHHRFRRSTVESFAAAVARASGPSFGDRARAWYEAHPERWLECPSTLCDPDRMAAALLATRTRLSGWGPAGDALAEGFLKPVLRSPPAAGLARCLRTSFLRSVACVAGRTPVPSAAPVAVVSWTSAPWADAAASLAVAVLREAGMCVLEAGSGGDPEDLAAFVSRQAPHQVCVVTAPVAHTNETAEAEQTVRALLTCGMRPCWFSPAGLPAPLGVAESHVTFARLGDAAARWSRV